MKNKAISSLPIRCAVLLLALATLLCALSGCGFIIINDPSGSSSAATTQSPTTSAPDTTAESPLVTEPPAEDTTSAPETEPALDPIVFPDRKDEAQERLDALVDPVGISGFTLIIASANDTADVIFCDEQSPLYAARSQRNAMLYEKFGVDIRTIYESVDSAKIYDDLLSSLQTGQNSDIYLDLIIIPASKVGEFLAKGLVKDMRSLPFYSYNGGSKSGNVGNSRYADLGNGTDAPEYIYALYFNRTMLGTDGTEKLYAAALDGKLTWETLVSTAKEVFPRAADIGVGEGAALLGDLAVKLSDVSYIVKDDSGVPKLEISDGNLARIDSLIDSVTKFTVYQPTESSAPALERFKSGDIPFYVGTLSDILDLYDEKTEWGLLPLPSDRNVGAVSDERPAICLPVTGTRLEQTSIWLEGFNAASGNWIRDAFLKSAIENYLRDNSSCLSLSRILSQQTELGFERVFSGYYSGLADATYGGAGEAASGNIRYSEIYAKKLSSLNKKLQKLP